MRTPPPPAPTPVWLRKGRHNIYNPYDHIAPHVDEIPFPIKLISVRPDPLEVLCPGLAPRPPSPRNFPPPHPFAHDYISELIAALQQLLELVAWIYGERQEEPEPPQ